jgi:hypothetical protein
MKVFFYAIDVHYHFMVGYIVAETRQRAIELAMRDISNQQLTVLPDDPDYDDFWYYGSILYSEILESLNENMIEIYMTDENSFSDYVADY